MSTYVYNSLALTLEHLPMRTGEFLTRSHMFESYQVSKIGKSISMPQINVEHVSQKDIPWNDHYKADPSRIRRSQAQSTAMRMTRSILEAESAQGMGLRPNPLKTLCFCTPQ